MTRGVNKDQIRHEYQKALYSLIGGTEITWPTYEFHGCRIKGEKPRHDMFYYLSTYGCCVLEFIRDTNTIHIVHQPTLGHRLVYLLDQHAATQT